MLSYEQEIKNGTIMLAWVVGANCLLIVAAVAAALFI